MKLDRLIPLLGIALVAGGVMAAATYLNLDRRIQSSEAYLGTLDRLFQDQQLSVVLKRLHEGDVAAATQHLDLLLCDNILLTNAELASADAQTRAAVQDTFRRIALLRPKPEPTGAASTQARVSDQDAAERILTLALATPNVADKQ
jgi:hypothetical protein